jgi:mRNA interferase MazF
VTRSDIVVLADRAGRYTGKPRPALIVQSDAFDGTDSVVVCLITSDTLDSALLRIPLHGPETGLERPSRVMAEKLTAVGRNQIGRVIGRADDITMLAVNRALAVFLGLV